MYWCVDKVEQQQRDALRNQCLDVLADVSGNDANANHAWMFREVADCVAWHVTADSRRPFSHEALHAALSRALWGAGAVDEARHLLERHVTVSAYRRAWQALLQERVLDPVLWEAVQRGVLRWHPQWTTANGQSLWALNVHRIAGWTEALALTRFLLIKTLLPKLAGVWHTSSGKGALGVYSNNGDASGRDQECLAWIHSTLAALRTRHDWSHTPTVLALTLS